MSRACPKCGFTTPPGMMPDDASCGQCGVVFAKVAVAEQTPLRDHLPSLSPPPDSGATHEIDLQSGSATPGTGFIPKPAPVADVPRPRTEEASPAPNAAGRFGYVSPGESILLVGLRGILLCLLAWWGYRFQVLCQPWGVQGHYFLHNPHLIFHEAGHMLFMPFGKFMTVAGGSLMQLIVPAAALFGLLFRPGHPDPFGAAVCLWWLGTSLIDLSPYIGDAQSLKLIMIGGFVAEDVADSHDWRNILWDLNLLRFDREIATAAHHIGNGLMLLAGAWAVWLLIRQARTALDHAAPDHTN